MSTIKEGCFHLDNRFEENDEAKSLGAKWGGKYIRKWHVPRGLSNLIHKFPSRWNPKLYLKCPYKEKNHAKKAGAKWDKDVRHWYITPNEDEKNFSEWLVGGAHLEIPTTVASAPALPPHSTQYDTAPPPPPSSSPSQSDRGTTTRGNAEMAKLLMTEPQALNVVVAASVCIFGVLFIRGGRIDVGMSPDNFYIEIIPKS